MCWYVSVWVNMVHTVMHVNTLAPTSNYADVYVQDLHVRLSTSVQMFHFVVLLTIIAFMINLKCAHMDTTLVTGS